MTIDGTDYIAMEKVLPPHYVRVVHKGFTVKLGTVVPEVRSCTQFQNLQRSNKSEKYLSMKTAVGAMQPAKMFTMIRKANLSLSCYHVHSSQ